MVDAEEAHYISAATLVLAQLVDAGVIPSDILSYVTKSNSEERKLSLLRAAGVVYPQSNLSGGSLPIDCVYTVPTGLAARLALGMPVGVGLTKKERHDWLSSGAKCDPWAWLAAPVGVEVRCVEVARWVVSLKPNQITALKARDRTGFSLAEHAIDLTAKDVAPHPSGDPPGVHEVIARREARLTEDEFGAEPLCSLPNWATSKTWRFTPLITGAALAREGREMSHCVGGYAGAVKSGGVLIASVRGWGMRATVEFDVKTGRIVQITGKSNSKPHPVIVRIAEFYAKRAKR